MNLQDTFLNIVRKEDILTTIFLVNGYQIRGLVKSFDNFTILLDVEGKQQMIYKHAISTMVPSKTVQLYEE
jgi:host factor-I protein